MKIDHARRLASNIVMQLRPYCDQIEVGGSIRRGKPEVKDIEVILIPKMLPKASDFFNSSLDQFERHPGFVRIINQWGKIKGEAKTGKYVQRIIDLRDIPNLNQKSINIDFFITDAEHFGNTFFIRTGPADFCAKAMKRLLDLGYKHEENEIREDGKFITCPTEERFFEILKWDFIPPHKRV